MRSPRTTIRPRRLIFQATAVTVLCLASSCSRGASKAAENPAPPSPSAAVPTATESPSAPGYPPPSYTDPSMDAPRSPVPTASKPPSDQVPIDQSLIPEATASYSFQQKTMNGISFPTVLAINSQCQPRKVEINAGRVRHRFLASLGIPDDEKSASVAQVDISVDNAAPVFSALVHFGELKDVNIDVSNGLRVRISISSMTNAPCDQVVGLGNPRFG